MSNTHPHADDEARRRDAGENLRFGVADHQETIRAADLKAEVLAVVLTVLLAVAEWEGHMSTSCLNGWLGIVAALAALIAFVLVGGVLWPRSDPGRHVSLGGYTPSRVLYPSIDRAPGQHVASHAQAALSTDWVSELTYELRKLGYIRKIKQDWFRFALIASAVVVLAVGLRLFFRVTCV